MSVNVLIADDSSTMRKIIIRSLNAVGITDIVEAADGAEAVAQFDQGTYQLVMLDWNMPEKTGLEVLQYIRTKNTEVPVMMVTTEAEKSRVLEAISAGASDYLVKPFDVDSLRQKLDRHCAVA